MLHKKEEKQKKGFIDLAEKYEESEIPVASKKREPVYPTLYISNKDLGLTMSDLEKEITATVKMVPIRITERKENGKESYSCDLKIKGIKIGE